MVRRLLMGIILLGVAGAAFSAERCTTGGEYEPSLCPFKLPKIEKITITRNAVKALAETDPTVSCENFRVNEKQVLRFFQLAKTTTANDAHYKLNWSPCFAGGEIVFSDGRLAYWSVDQYQAGSLGFDDKDESIILFCPRCKFKPFMWDGVTWPYQEK
ncbi:hypothetical protein [Collimonas antrihumi]|uniref:hypothetical protein n=1 Tax=Collimonas antrihumi TaxID=1940615 RepID=UPI001B8AC567|nr:hypothetical protein [Collimonas antrihumi]